MPLLNLDLMTPDGVVLQGSELPDHLQCEELIARLLNALVLNTVTPTGEPIYYLLEIVNQGRELAHGQSLAEAGVAHGDVIRLVSSHKPIAPEPEPTPTVALKTKWLNGGLVIIPVGSLAGDEATSITQIFRRLGFGQVVSAPASANEKTTDETVTSHSAPVVAQPNAVQTRPLAAPAGKPRNYRQALIASMALAAAVLFLLPSPRAQESEIPPTAPAIAQQLAPPVKVVSPPPVSSATPETSIAVALPEPLPATTVQEMHQPLRKRSTTRNSAETVKDAAVTAGVALPVIVGSPLPPALGSPEINRASLVRHKPVALTPAPSALAVEASEPAVLKLEKKKKHCKFLWWGCKEKTEVAASDQETPVASASTKEKVAGAVKAAAKEKAKQAFTDALPSPVRKVF